MDKETFIELYKNNIQTHTITGLGVAWDNCHKIYVIENKDDEKNAIDIGYSIYPLEQLEEIYNNSCNLRFISNWALTTRFIDQFEDEDKEIVLNVVHSEN